jgi:hypothetical protein
MVFRFLISLFSDCKRHFLFSFHHIFPPLSLKHTQHIHTRYFTLYLSHSIPLGLLVVSLAPSLPQTHHLHTLLLHIYLYLSSTPNTTHAILLYLSLTLYPPWSPFCFSHSTFLTLTHTHT